MTGNDEDRRDDTDNQSGWPLLPIMREFVDSGYMFGYTVLNPLETYKTYAPTLNQWSWGLLGKTVSPKEKYSPDLTGRVIFVTGGRLR